MTLAPTRYDLVELHGRIDAAALGHNIRTARRSAGLTQAEVVGSDVSSAYLSRIESGERRPEFSLLERIAGRLGVSTEQLLTGLDGEQRGAISLRLGEVPSLLRAGDLDAAQRTLAEADALLDGTSDPGARGEIAYLRAATALAAGDVDQAVDGLRAILDAPDEDPAAAWRVPAASSLVDAHLEAGRDGEAVEAGETALARLEDVGLSGAPEALVLATRVARVHLVRRDYAAATVAARRAIPGIRKLDLAAAYREAAEKELASGAVHVAGTYVRYAAEAEAEAGRDRARAEHLAVLGELLLVDGQAAPDLAARETLARALPALQATDAPSAETEAVRILLARAALADGDDAVALEVLEGTDQDALVDEVVSASWLVVRGQIDQRAGRLDEAVRNFDAAAEALGELEPLPERRRGAAAQLWYELGALHDERDDSERARIAYRAAASLTARP